MRKRELFIPIIYPTALNFWMDSQKINLCKNLLSQKIQRIRLPEKYIYKPDPKIVHSIIQEYNLPAPIRLLAPSVESRRNNALINCAINPRGLKSACFIELKKINYYSKTENTEYLCHVLIASPELCFLQASKDLSFFGQIKLGYDLCSGYITDAFSSIHQNKRPPLTDIESISSFLRNCKNVQGTHRSILAIKYVLNNSFSPMETKIAILGMLPFHYGGCAILTPELNNEVILSREGKEFLGKSTCCCDLIWEKNKIIAEYDSDLTHLTSDQHSWDKRKATALSLSGYKVISITSQNMQTLNSIEDTFIMIRKALGMRSRVKEIRYSSNKRKELLLFLNNN